MPRYFFDIHNGRRHTDDRGEELGDDNDAWRSALRLTRDVEDNLAPGGQWELQVRQGDRPLFRIEVKSEWLK